jgi:small subunit ribosomal protein S8
MTDPIADYLTRISNAYQQDKKVVEIPSSSKMKVALTKILFEKGYILSYKFEEAKTCRYISKSLSSIILRPRQPAIKRIERISTPGMRQYSRV